MADLIQIESNDDQVQTALHNLLQRMDDLTPAMEDIAGILINAAEDAFLTETSPFGDKWLPLAESTLARAAKRGRTSPKILQDTGQLASSGSTDAGKDFAELSFGKVYAAIQHLGGEAGRDHSVEIPSRKYVPMDEDGNMPELVSEQIIDVLGDYLIA
jgi:phage virion morphogenesis protein